MTIPPLKSQGIKTKLVPWIQSIVPACNGRWIEPFLGTGVVGFNSGFRNALLGDINPHIIAFYQAIKDGKITQSSVRDKLESESLLLTNSEENGYVYFRAVRNRFNSTHDPMDLLFLSRAGFNGMMRFNRKGEWNIPFCKKPMRFSKSYITKIANQVRNLSCLITPGWQFKCASFETLILQATADDIIYCDPPYLGRYVDYYSGWNENDERRLFELLSVTPAKFILSTWHHNNYRENTMIAKYWAAFHIVTKDHFYHSGGKLENRQSIVEALVCNFPCETILPASSAPIRHEQLELFEGIA